MTASQHALGFVGLLLLIVGTILVFSDDDKTVGLYDGKPMPCVGHEEGHR